MLIWGNIMHKLRVRHYRVSKKGTTLVELVVSLTLMAIFALACTALIVPIERSYRETVRLARAQLLADTLVDSIRKECDDVKHDEKASVWIANFNESSSDDASLLSQGPGIKAGAGRGNALIFQRNNNYTEAIYACVPISGDNFTNVANNPLTDPNTAHAINALDNAGGENLKSGIVHFGYYQAKEDDRGVFPIQSYDYTNPVMASTYGEFTVKLEFNDLVLKDGKYPAYVNCKVSVYVGDCNSDKNKLSGPFYTRTTVISFSANGSGSGSGGHSHHQTEDKDVSITIKWVDSQDAAIVWPDDVASINVQLAENDGTKKTHTLLKGQSRFVFANVNVKGTITITSSELDDYEYTVKGNAVSGYVITYKSVASDLVKLVSGAYFDSLVEPYASSLNTTVIFGKYSDYASKVKGVEGKNVAINIKATNDKNRTDEYKLYVVPYYPTIAPIATAYTIYVLSEDGRFVANENCEGMFKDSRWLTNITGMDNVDTYLTTNMKNMFKNCRAMQQFNMPHLIKAKCQTTEGMFDNCDYATHFDLSSCDTSGVKNMNRMFCDVGASELDLSSFDFSSVTTADEMFYEAYYLKRIKVDGKSSDSASGSFTLYMPKCTSASSIFGYNTALATFNGKLLLPACTDFSNAFYGCSSLQSIDLSNSNFNKCNNFSNTFSWCTSLSKIRMDGVDLDAATNLNFISLNTVKELYMTGAKLSSVTSLEEWYQNKNIQKIVFSESTLSSCTTTKNMFNSCSKLAEVVMDDLSFPACTTVESMFQSCSSLKTVHMSNLITTGCSTYTDMFSKTAAVEEMYLPGWQTGPGLTSLAQYWLFRGGRPNMLSAYNRNNLKYVDISYWKTPYILDMEYAFESASALIDVKMVGFDAPNMTAGRYAFQNDAKLQTVDMTDADLSKISAVFFFSGTKALTTVTCSTGKNPGWTGNSFNGSKINANDVIYV